jgi:unsaturated chondroitin disaccharide hydrolase
MPALPNEKLTPNKLRKNVVRLFDLAGQKILAIDAVWDPARGTPGFTVKGRYT